MKIPEDMLKVTHGGDVTRHHSRKIKKESQCTKTLFIIDTENTYPNNSA